MRGKRWTGGKRNGASGEKIEDCKEVRVDQIVRKREGQIKERREA